MNLVGPGSAPAKNTPFSISSEIQAPREFVCVTREAGNRERYEIVYIIAVKFFFIADATINQLLSLKKLQQRESTETYILYNTKHYFIIK
jgi:hypothetical protein